MRDNHLGVTCSDPMRPNKSTWAAENERLLTEIAALKAELAGYKTLLSSVRELADAEKFEEVTDMIDTVLPTIGRAALEGGQQ